MQRFRSTSILKIVNKRHGDVTASRGSTDQTDPKNYECSNGSIELIHLSLIIYGAIYRSAVRARHSVSPYARLHVSVSGTYDL